jgi:hypothetical protein
LSTTPAENGKNVQTLTSRSIDFLCVALVFKTAGSPGFARCQLISPRASKFSYESVPKTSKMRHRGEASDTPEQDWF